MVPIAPLMLKLSQKRTAKCQVVYCYMCNSLFLWWLLNLGLMCHKKSLSVNLNSRTGKVMNKRNGKHEINLTFNRNKQKVRLTTE